MAVLSSQVERKPLVRDAELNEVACGDDRADYRRLLAIALQYPMRRKLSDNPTITRIDHNDPRSKAALEAEQRLFARSVSDKETLRVGGHV